MAIPTVNVTVHVEDSSGNAVEGARVNAKLNRTEVDEGIGYVVPLLTTVTTDASGDAVLVLWPNELGATESSYEITMSAAGSRDITSFTATIPNSNVNLWDVADLPVYPGKSGGGLTLAQSEKLEDVWQSDHVSGWKDLLSSIHPSGVPQQNAPTSSAFGPSGIREEKKFAIGDYVFASPYHVNHDIDPGAEAHIHIHWSTDGTSTNTVKWELEIMRAKGHGQEAFEAPITITLEAAPNGTAWTHYVTEVDPADVMYLIEPDEVLLVTPKRITNGGTDNTDGVFALQLDIHYQSTRDVTPSKVPNFYT